jgi:cysteine desulfuration protein SufE
MNIAEVQEQIILEFSMIGADMEMATLFVMESGEKLPAMDESLKIESNLVKGCQSKVWLSPELKDDKINFHADSNAAITKGLIYFLIRIYDGRTPDEILESELFFMDKIGMNRFIGTQRSNGFLSMIKQIKMYALAFKSKINA